MNRTSALVAAACLLLANPACFGCGGNEYWDDDPKGFPVWTSRNEIDLNKSGNARVTDDLLRTALGRSGLHSCSGVEKDLLDADVQRAIRTQATPAAREHGWTNYREITQVLIRHRLRPKLGPMLEVMTRTKICTDRSGKFVPAPLDYQSNAVAVANKVAENLAALTR
jgi:hypothetical protein